MKLSKQPFKLAGLTLLSLSITGCVFDKKSMSYKDHDKQHAAKRMHKGMHKGHLLLKFADSDGDGMLTMQELITAKTKEFPMVDSNNDGKISKSELTAHMQAMDAKHMSGHHRKMKMHRMKDKMDAKMKDKMEAKFNKMDRNGDGTISMEEYTMGAKLTFKRMDKNSDGMIDSDDMKHHMKSKKK